jgi:hypothetical protein
MPSIKYDLLICELFNKKLHGYDETSDPNVIGHYMVLNTYGKERFDLNGKQYKIKKDCEFYNKKYNVIGKYKAINNPIRNYKNIIKNPNYIQLHIGQKNYLSGGECVCILKTFWISIFQRIWKRVYQRRKKLLLNPIPFLFKRELGCNLRFI